MDKWEYKFVKLESPVYIHKVNIAFDALGQDGWELCGHEYAHAIFKRKVVSPNALAFGG